MNEISRGEMWDEDLLCQEVAKHLARVGRKPGDYPMIADGTGKNQSASGRQRGKESDPDSWSFAIVERYGWEPHAALEERRQVVGKQGAGSGWDTVPSNPRTAICLELINQLLRSNRVLITPNCPETAESFRTCELKNKKPFGRGSHLTDAVSYPLFCLEQALRAKGIVKIVDQDEQDDKVYVLAAGKAVGAVADAAGFRWGYGTPAIVAAAQPKARASRSSAGISARQGAHHVAQRFISTVLPAWSARVIGLASGELKASAFSDFGGSAGSIAATCPFASAAIALA